MSGTLIVWGINHHGCLGLGKNGPADGEMQRLPIHVSSSKIRVAHGERLLLLI